MASNPPGKCCTVGVKHEGEPTGQKIKIDSIDAYVAEPSGNTIHEGKAILYIPDAFGLWQNAFLMADQFAANGYYTVVVDPFNGDPMSHNRPPGFDIMAWLNKGSDGNNPHTPEFVDKIVEKSIAFLQEKGFKKIGGVGYCFGAKYVVRFLTGGKGIDVGYSAHPSFVTEEELTAITGPYAISAAEVDQIFTAELRHKSEEILVKTKQPYQINLFSGTLHGFAVRCDLSDPVQKWAKEQAFLQAVTWFDTHL